MWPPLGLLIVVLIARMGQHPCDAHEEEHLDEYQLTDEQYYQLPRLFALDDYEQCISQRRSVYCVGSFQLAPTNAGAQLYDTLERYSANWIDRFNHTRLHRGVCLSAACTQQDGQHSEEEKFASCVNESVVAQHGLTATLYKLEYCGGHEQHNAARSSDVPDKLFAALVALILLLAVLSTIADMLLTQQEKTARPWLVSYSVRTNWQTLTQDTREDMRVFDGLRAFSMICVVMEHVCWITTSSYQMNPRFTELTRRSPEALLLSNSTLLVQVFFILSSFLLAHKLLQTHTEDTPGKLFADTILNRIVRISPAYWCVVGFAATWWPRLGSGPLWQPLVEAESAVCRRKWWPQLLYLNNAWQQNDKCLIQTWYLAADMQLYAIALLLTLALRKWRRHAVALLCALLTLVLATLTALSLLWQLQPTFILHNPEAVRASYADDASFNWLYQSALGNAPGAITGLLLAFLHDELLRRGVRLNKYKYWSWVCVVAAPCAALWMLLSPPLLLAKYTRVGAALMAGTERGLFSVMVGGALLGALHGVGSPWRRALAWQGWRLPARAAYAVLLLHMLLNKVMVGARAHLTQLTRINAICEWAAVYVLAFLLALPFCLLVELPPARLYRALRSGGTQRHNSQAPQEKVCVK